MLEWHKSPWFRLVDRGEDEMRRNLAAGEGVGEFPILSELAAQGATDYWARLVRFGAPDTLGNTRGVATSFATCRAGGFADAHLDLIRATLPALALAFKASLAVETARTLVTTYLGHGPAERILCGEIERGQVSTVRRVLWFSDLAGFTRIADTVPRPQLLDLLNAYADTIVSIVHAHGGEVLKFMGDGILAAFDGGEDNACERALDAADAARLAIERLNQERAQAGLPVTTFTLALHEGEVAYGNVGSRDRLDFTVLGPAVNELSRIQAMSRSIDRAVLVSSAFRLLRPPARSPGLGRSLCAARHRPATGALHPRSRLIAASGIDVDLLLRLALQSRVVADQQRRWVEHLRLGSGVPLDLVGEPRVLRLPRLLRRPAEFLEPVGDRLVLFEHLGKLRPQPLRARNQLLALVRCQRFGPGRERRANQARKGAELRQRVLLLFLKMWPERLHDGGGSIADLAARLRSRLHLGVNGIVAGRHRLRNLELLA